MQKLEFSHYQDGCCPKTTFSIAESVVSSGIVSRDLLEYSGSEILYVIAATDRKMLRNLTRATDFLLIGQLKLN